MLREPVFLSKIIVPKRSSRTLRRDRLVGHLTADDGRPITMVVAPAGYGKTTLLIDVANESVGDIAWVSLDEWDSDPVTFLMYMRSALASAGHVSDARRPTPTPAGLHQYLGAIVHEVETAARPTTLIIDDFHTVEDSPEIVDLLDYLTRRLPACMKLVIASRRRSNLKSVPKLRLQNLIEYQGVDDLSFTREEIEEFYRVQGLELTNASITRVLEVTKGWPAGVALIRDPAAMGEAVLDESGEIPDYLTTEVLGDLPADLKEFLRLTSVLGVLDAEACDWLLETDSSAATLAVLARSSIPMTHTGLGDSEVRIHPLVRDFLRAELKSTDVELYRALHVRASERAEALGQQSEAISHQIEGGNWREVARLVTQQAPKFYRLGRWHTIAAWLRAIPSAQLDENPDLRWWEARILARLGQIDSALRVISEALPQTNDLTRVAQFETLRASALRGKGDVSGALAAAQRALELSLEQNAPIDTVAEARKELGLALVAEGAFTPAIDELRAALALQEKSGNTEESAFLNGCLGSALGSVGSLVESAEHLERSRQQWQAAGNAKELSWVLNNLGMVYQRAGQLEMASDILKQCIGKSRQSGNRRAEAYALSSLGEIELAAGDVRSAKQRYEEASEISVELDDNTALTHARCGLAYCYGKLGEARKGQTLARQALASAEERGSPFEQGIALSAIGSLLRQQGSLNEAVERFSEAVSLFEQTSSTPELAKTLLLLSDAALPLRGSRSMVRVSLDRFVRLTDDLGEAAYSLVPAGEIEPLLEFGASRKAGGALFREMLRRSVKGGGDNTDTEQPTPESRLPSIEMRALGTFEVSVDGRTVLNVEWESEKSKELFLLIASAPRPLTRDGIIAALWPEAGGKKATSAFHSTLHRLRGATYREAITESGGEYCLNVKAHLKSDLGAFNQAITESEDPDMDEAVRLGALRRAVDLYKGSFAPGFDGEWTTAIRISLEEQFLRASFRLTEKLIAAGDYKAAIASCERILEVDPFSESACRHLMKSHVAMGDSESALRAYRRFSEALELELGETPGAGLRRLHVEIRGQANRSLGLLS